MWPAFGHTQGDGHQAAGDSAREACRSGQQESRRQPGDTGTLGWAREEESGEKQEEGGPAREKENRGPRDTVGCVLGRRATRVGGDKCQHGALKAEAPCET